MAIDEPGPLDEDGVTTLDPERTSRMRSMVSAETRIADDNRSHVFAIEESAAERPRVVARSRRPLDEQ